MPMVGSNWSHDGVSELYNNIDGNGYHMIYISSRGIGQIDRTKSYLESLSLPKGPVLLAPHGLLESYSRIKSHKNVEFKIAVLNALRDLFPASNPFACGFGNTQEDQRAYAQVGIPLSKILDYVHLKLSLGVKVIILTNPYSKLHNLQLNFKMISWNQSQLTITTVKQI